MRAQKVISYKSYKLFSITFLSGMYSTTCGVLIKKPKINNSVWEVKIGL